MDSLTVLQVIALSVVGIPISFKDIRDHKIYNRDLLSCSVAILPMTIFTQICANHYWRLGQSFLYTLGFSLILFAIASFKSAPVGMGDVKLLVLVSFALSLYSLNQYQNWLLWVMVVGSIIAIFHTVRWHTMGTRIAFAPAVFVGTLAYLATRK